VYKEDGTQNYGPKDHLIHHSPWYFVFYKL